MVQIDLKKIEEKWKNYWETEKIYKFDGSSRKKIYSIDTPPPTVSGEMHIGHAFSYSQEDFIARFMRMNSFNVFYPFGTDDNGLPTERLVEKINNVKSKRMPRGEFIELCLKTLKEITPEFVQNWKNLGMSCDFDISYSTINKESHRLSQKSFIELFNKKEIYEKEFPSLWCPECQTSIAQAELEDQERITSLVYLKAKLEDGSFIIYATTRPELHPGCVGISINENGTYVKVKSKDEIWIISKEAYEKMKFEFPLKLVEEFKGNKIIGKIAIVKYSEQNVLISHDISAKTEYGTGVVYYCSYGGLDCVQWMNRHQEVKPVIVMQEKGVYIKGPCKGLKSFEAREKIVELLKKEGHVIKEEKLNHIVNVHDKCGTPIEFISTKQWFIKVLDKKKKLIELGTKINWYPEFMQKRYVNWINGLEWDWNISRDRHFGIPIPVWKCENCHNFILAKESKLPIDPLITPKKCPKCGELAKPEKKVLDTWATSSLTPQIASNLVKNKTKLPFSLRPQAHDIIRTWAFYTIVKSYLHENKIPWKNIIISGNVSLGGEKMSKSKGNIISPKEIMEKYSADALRYWAAGSKLGNDLDYQEKDLVAGTKLINKLLNASNFVFMNLKDYDGKKPKKLEELDEKFLIELNRVIFTTTSRFENYDYSKAKFNIEEFFWKFFCDLYLESVKKRVYSEKGDKKKSAQWTLYQSFLAILKMFAPFIPFITEEIYQGHFKIFEKEKSIHLIEWPKLNKKEFKKWDEPKIKTHANELTLFSDLLTQVRIEKTKVQKPMNAECILTLNKLNYEDLKGMLEDFKNVTNAKEIKSGENFRVEFI